MLKLQKFLRTKKGFTLVEVIVVLVILAILAAISIPALTGYISKANEKAAIAEARTVLVAMQTISSELYAYNVAWPDVALYLMNGTIKNKNFPKGYSTTVNGLCGLSGADGFKRPTEVSGFSKTGRIDAFKLKTSGGETVQYKDGVFTVLAS